MYQIEKFMAAYKEYQKIAEQLDEKAAVLEEFIGEEWTGKKETEYTELWMQIDERGHYYLKKSLQKEIDKL